MDIYEATDLVLTLAAHNLCDQDEMPEEFERQAKAIEIVQADLNLRLETNARQ